ncbi:unnamed protein product [Linum tenue]|uniref:Uncharacterized protein n=3 Tax=Linum TaxID=4005 RepID=A0AAV0L3E1_9ROSI|nr:unnamed protein product [Linum tenue]
MAGPDQAARQSSEVLQQRSGLPKCPVKMAVVGAVIAAGLGYTVLFAKKKPEATALDVAKVASGGNPPSATKY